MKSLIVLGLLFSNLALAQQGHTHAPLSDRPAVHGMLLFGNSEIYLSHLPMFHSPHDYQVILKVSLNPGARYILQLDRVEHPEAKYYTIVPERFSLPDMIASPRPFKAQLVRGHFERGGEVIAASTTVTIETVLSFTKFDPSAVQPAASSYIVFGTPDEAYAAHKITAKPDFDHVIPVSGEITKKLTLENPVIQVGLKSPNGKPVGEGSQIQPDLSTGETIYLEFGDLAD